MPAREIGFVDQILQDKQNRTLAQQTILSGDRNMIRLLRTKFEADLGLPVSSVDDIPLIFTLPESRAGLPAPTGQFNCYCLIACSVPRDLWFAYVLIHRSLVDENADPANIARSLNMPGLKSTVLLMIHRSPQVSTSLLLFTPYLIASGPLVNGFSRTVRIFSSEQVLIVRS